MEAVRTYTPVASSDEVFDEFWNSLTEDDRIDLIESIEDGHRAVKRGEYYEWDEVLHYLDKTTQQMKQGCFPKFDEYLAKLANQFGGPREDICL